ncbi:MarR family winged helix-turn-helix transcriptional regulator [Streptomyces bikiniensis]|uniref:MarR family winged helix-turn-helix transcriptional regulator n=1 Tax=Streptomyces bikiniensis TaxID=1896 RepID=UPI000690810C|nr:MarR family transcriptional regulator [Streptomyces bikiniensis]
MSWRPEEASRRDGAEDSAAGVALEVLELLEVLWSQGETVSTAPLSSSQVRVLYVLEREGVVNLRTLAEKLDSMPSSVSRMCDRLQAVGFIDRGHNPCDRRELELRLSRRGAGYLRAFRSRREEVLRGLLGKMTPTEQALLVRGLSGIRTAAGAGSPGEETGAGVTESA